MTLTSDQIEVVLRTELGLDGTQNVIAFAHRPALGPVDGGATAIVRALIRVTKTLVMPAFTYQTQVVPQTGPEDNDLAYGTGKRKNERAEFFLPDLPVHPDIGSVSEEMRTTEGTLRSTHPILSFIANGPDARKVLASQTRKNPLGPIAWLEAHEGYVLLMGRDQRHNYALHLAEQRAGRKFFTRWALTIDDIEQLDNIPGSREGFNQIWLELQDITLVTSVGMARTELIPLRPLLKYTEKRIQQDSKFLLK